MLQSTKNASFWSHPPKKPRIISVIDADLRSTSKPGQRKEEILKKGRNQSSTALRKRQWERWWFIASQLGGAFHSGTPEQRDVSHKLPAPRHLESFQSHKSQSLEGLRTKSPLASRLGKSRSPHSSAPTPGTRGCPKTQQASHKFRFQQTPPLSNILNVPSSKKIRDWWYFTFLQPTE